MTKNNLIKLFQFSKLKDNTVYSMFLELGITKDNPTFSMINDSDEDVIYGSEEESRRPLNRSRNDDDSDQNFENITDCPIWVSF